MARAIASALFCAAARSVTTTAAPTIFIDDENVTALAPTPDPTAAPTPVADHCSAGCCIARDRANFTGLVLGCIEAKFC